MAEPLDRPLDAIRHALKALATDVATLAQELRGLRKDVRAIGRLLLSEAEAEGPDIEGPHPIDTIDEEGG